MSVEELKKKIKAASEVLGDLYKALEEFDGLEHLLEHVEALEVDLWNEAETLDDEDEE